jgi:hypothetical protein
MLKPFAPLCKYRKAYNPPIKHKYKKMINIGGNTNAAKKND